MADINALLYRDFDGRPVADPSDVVFAGLEDPRHVERVPELVAIMRDATCSPFDRLAATTALTGWGERAGYEMVAESARQPRSAPWYGISVDRRFSVDDTFSAFANAIDVSHEICEDKGTRAERTEALRALVRIADTEYFDDKLDYAFDEGDPEALAADLVETVNRGIRSLSAGEKPRFDLLSQLLDLVAVLVETSEQEAVELGFRLLELERSPRAARHAVGIVTRGTQEESKAFGEYLALVGDEETRGHVEKALARRTR
jgi:hypothetical protein